MELVVRQNTKNEQVSPMVPRQNSRSYVRITERKKQRIKE